MPNRIVREGLIDSERVDQLSVHGERFYIRLLLKADDFGRFSGNVLLLKAALFPLKQDVRDADIPRWIAECEKAGLVRRYEVSGKHYLEVLDFRQRSRAEKSKYPAPPMFHGEHAVLSRASDGQPSDTRPTAAHVVGDGDEGGDDRARKRAEVFVPPDWVPPKEWGEFMESRKRHPPTHRAKELLVIELEKLRDTGHDPAKVLEQSTRNNWRDLFPLRGTNGSKTNRGNPSLADQAAQSERDAAGWGSDAG